MPKLKKLEGIEQPERTTFRFPAALLEQLRVRARQAGTTVSKYVYDLLVKALREEQK